MPRGAPDQRIPRVLARVELSSNPKQATPKRPKQLNEDADKNEGGIERNRQKERQRERERERELSEESGSRTYAS